MIDAVRTALEQAATVQEVKDVLNAAKAAETYAQQVKAGKAIELKLSEYIVRAERKLGEILRAAKAAGQVTHHVRGDVVDNNDNIIVRLSDAGISRDLSSRAQKLANIPEKDFEQKLAQQKQTGALSVKKLIASDSAKWSKPPKQYEGAPQVIKLFEDGSSLKEIIEQTGVRPRIVDYIIREEKVRRSAQGTVTPEMLSLTAREKLERAISRQMQKLASEFQLKVETEVNRRIRLVMDRWQLQQDQAKRVIESRKGIMNAATYKKILVCLHPDWVTDPKQKARYEDAFIAFSKLEKLLLDEKDSPTQFAPPLPKTAAEWAELKRKAAEAARAKRKANALAKARK